MVSLLLPGRVAARCNYCLRFTQVLSGWHHGAGISKLDPEWVVRLKRGDPKRKTPTSRKRAKAKGQKQKAKSARQYDNFPFYS